MKIQIIQSSMLVGRFCINCVTQFNEHLHFSYTQTASQRSALRSVHQPTTVRHTRRVRKRSERRRACAHSAVLTVLRRSVASSQSAPGLSQSVFIFFLSLSVCLSVFSLRSDRHAHTRAHTHVPQQTRTPLCYTALTNELL